MLPQVQLDNWFTYHPPTAETEPKYAAIRAAEGEVYVRVTQTVYEVGPDIKQVYDEINRVTRRFAEVIDANAPDSADKTAAIRCVRLARNLLNEWVTQRAKPVAGRDHNDVQALYVAAEMELRRARWQANSAIACGGK